MCTQLTKARREYTRERGSSKAGSTNQIIAAFLTWTTWPSRSGDEAPRHRSTLTGKHVGGATHVICNERHLQRAAASMCSKADVVVASMLCGANSRHGTHTTSLAGAHTWAATAKFESESSSTQHRSPHSVAPCSHTPAARPSKLRLEQLVRADPQVGGDPLELR